MDFGLELYTVRKMFRHEWKKAPALVRETGYLYVEFFDCVGIPPLQMKEESDRLGLRISATT